MGTSIPSIFANNNNTANTHLHKFTSITVVIKDTEISFGLISLGCNDFECQKKKLVTVKIQKCLRYFLRLRAEK